MLDLGKAESLSDLIDIAHLAERDFGGTLWYRGQVDAKWELKPSAHRRHPQLEAECLQHFRIKAPALSQRCPDHRDYVSWLPLMQHYGLPTRLLDWTESLLIAVFFALHENTGTDSVIWMLSPWNLNEEHGAAKIPFLTADPVSPYVRDAFSGTTPDNRRHTLAVMAPRSDRRMMAQLGNYTIHGSRSALDKDHRSDKFLGRVVLPKSGHDRLKGDMLVTGVTMSSVYPDLSHLAKEIAQIKALDGDGNILDASWSS